VSPALDSGLSGISKDAHTDNACVTQLHFARDGDDGMNRKEDTSFVVRFPYDFPDCNAENA